MKVMITAWFVILISSQILAIKISNSYPSEGVKGQCGNLCQSCKSDASANECDVCKPGIMQYGFKCYNICPDGTYSDKEWQVCRKCDDLCPVCWGPLSTMCGQNQGINSRLILLENEIGKWISENAFDEDENAKWMKTLRAILEGKEDDIEYSKPEDLETFSKVNKPNKNIHTFSTTEIYGNSQKIPINLPEGSFSRNNGVFIPIPTYQYNEDIIVHSHWIYVKGIWNGFKWLNNWAPLVPSFLKTHGSKSSIYFENDGYWIYNTLSNEWQFSKTDIKLIKSSSTIPNSTYVNQLNTLKLGNDAHITKRLTTIIAKKKENLRDNIQTLFGKVKTANDAVYSKLRETAEYDKRILNSMLMDLKSRIKVYLNEEEILKDSISQN